MTTQPDDTEVRPTGAPEQPARSRAPATSRRFGGRLMATQFARVAAGPEAAFAAIERIGGANGWYAAQSLWQLRGWLDDILGGVGMGRGRRDPHTLIVGDVVDFWRVEALERNRLLRLASEMKLPGRAWLEFEVRAANGTGTAVIRQTAIFDPVGLAGQAYWYVLWPFHLVIFTGMLRGLARYAEGRMTRPG